MTKYAKKLLNLWYSKVENYSMANENFSVTNYKTPEDNFGSGTEKLE